MNGQDYMDNGFQGWMSLEELRWLYDQAKSANVVVEIGSWMGRSTHAFLSTGKPVVAVDHFKGSVSQIEDVHKWAAMNDLYQAFKLNVGHFPNLTVMRMDSPRASEFFKDRSIDMVFIDGDHEYGMVKRDIEAWMPKCRTLLCGHDRGENGVPHVLAESGLPVKDEAGCIWSVRV